MNDDSVIGMRSGVGPDFRSISVPFGISQTALRQHLFCVGKSGYGKTTLFHNLMVQDIERGDGFAFFDPHGDEAAHLIEFIPRHRINDVVYLNPSDLSYPIGFNVVESVMPDMRAVVAGNLASMCEKIWADAWGNRVHRMLRNTFAALIECPGTTLLGSIRMLNDTTYRAWVLRHVQDESVLLYWENIFDKWSESYRAEAVSPAENKLGEVLATPHAKLMLGQLESKIDFRHMIDNRRILIVNLSKGRLGEDASRLIGSILFSQFELAAKERTAVPEAERVGFKMYLDEFQNFTTEALPSSIDESRKYALSLILASQRVSSLSPSVRDAVLEGVGSMVAFRVGGSTAEALSDELECDDEFLMKLDPYEVRVKRIYDGRTDQAFTGITIPSAGHYYNSGQRVINNSRERFGVRRAVVEGQIGRWLADKKTPMKFKRNTRAAYRWEFKRE